MKTILNTFAIPVDEAIAEAHACLVGLETLFRYENLPYDRQNDRHLILDALNLLTIEVEAKAAGVPIAAERRVLLGGALQLVKEVVMNHGWGFLVGEDDAQKAANIALVERFETARRTITVACCDLEWIMDA
jgi:hypothetical protein